MRVPNRVMMTGHHDFLFACRDLLNRFMALKPRCFTDARVLNRKCSRTIYFILKIARFQVSLERASSAEKSQQGLMEECERLRSLMRDMVPTQTRNPKPVCLSGPVLNLNRTKLMFLRTALVKKAFGVPVQKIHQDTPKVPSKGATYFPPNSEVGTNHLVSFEVVPE